MSKKYIQMALASAILGVISPNPSYAQDQAAEKKVMQTHSYSIPEDLKQQMIENIKKNRGEKEEGQSTTSDINEPENKQIDIESPSDSSGKKTPSAEEKIWKKYKGLASGLDEEEQPTEQSEEDIEEDDETLAAQEDSGAADMSSILQNYKNSNNTQMQTRSFSIPEAIEKHKEKPEKSSDPETGKVQEGNTEEKSEIKKQKKISAEKMPKNKQKKETKITIKTND